MSTVDATGRATASWNIALVGRQVVDPRLLATSTNVSGSSVFTTGAGSHEVVDIVAALPGSRPGEDPSFYAVWQQDQAGLYGDLRRGAHSRDVALLVVVGVSIAALAYSNHRRERALRRSQRRRYALLRHAHDLLVVIGGDERVRFVSSAVETLLGTSADDYVGKSLHSLVDVDVYRALRTTLHRARTDGTRTVLGVHLQDANGVARRFDIAVRDLRADRMVRGFLLTCHDVGERQHLEDELRVRATHDVLTGLGNRALLTGELDRLTEETRSEQYAAVFIDLDHFKPINDRLGHRAGDEVLRIVASRLSAAVRPGDVVCRLGGDEFALLLPDVDDAEAHVIAQRMLESLRVPIAVDGHVVHVDASVGIAVAPADGAPQGNLVRLADNAMYRAKQAGRGRLVVASA
jgi:diguanylate cyclase (GGDEF)-like protein/PAS domain S-box-containing protein